VTFCDALLRSDSHELVTVGALTTLHFFPSTRMAALRPRCNAVVVIWSSAMHLE
jgi:hypothetical protein